MLADPGGNELCVIEPSNNFLAGTGYLGEVTCDGTRAAGLFWRDALGLATGVGRERADRDPVAARRHQDLLGLVENRSPNPREGEPGSASTSSASTQQ